MSNQSHINASNQYLNNSEVKHLEISVIRENVHGLLNDLKSSKAKKLISKNKFAELRGTYGPKYQDLMYIYPALFNMVLEHNENFDMNQLESMLKAIEKVRNKEVTNEQASVKFGQEMVDKYVKPKIEN